MKASNMQRTIISLCSLVSALNTGAEADFKELAVDVAELEAYLAELSKIEQNRTTTGGAIADNLRLLAV